MSFPNLVRISSSFVWSLHRTLQTLIESWYPGQRMERGLWKISSNQKKRSMDERSPRPRKWVNLSTRQRHMEIDYSWRSYTIKIWNSWSPEKKLKYSKTYLKKLSKLPIRRVGPFPPDTTGRSRWCIAKFEIMGSFRRGEEVSSDIDVVVWHPYVSLTLCSRQSVLIVDHSSLGIETKRGLRR